MENDKLWVRLYLLKAWLLYVCGCRVMAAGHDILNTSMHFIEKDRQIIPLYSDTDCSYPFWSVILCVAQRLAGQGGDDEAQLEFHKYRSQNR